VKQSAPASVMTASRPVQNALQRLPPQQLAAVRPIFGQPLLQPAAATAGVTPAGSRQMHLAPALPGSGCGAGAGRAPGPSILGAISWIQRDAWDSGPAGRRREVVLLFGGQAEYNQSPWLPAAKSLSAIPRF